jgi:hypothetical protein
VERDDTPCFHPSPVGVNKTNRGIVGLECWGAIDHVGMSPFPTLSQCLFCSITLILLVIVMLSQLSCLQNMVMEALS